jgi:hypothetical protein
MRCAPALMIGALIALAAPSAVWAQLLATVMRLPSSPDAVLKKGLRKLVTAQEQSFSNHGTYTTDVSQLGFYTLVSRRVTPSGYRFCQPAVGPGADEPFIAASGKRAASSTWACRPTFRPERR